MTDWTQEANEYLDGYLTQVAALAKRQGDDAEDIVSGLRDHIVQEAESKSSGTVDLDGLLAALAIIGTPEEVVNADVPLNKSEVIASSVSQPRGKERRTWLGCSLVAILVVAFAVIPIICLVLFLFVFTFSTTQFVEVIPEQISSSNGELVYKYSLHQAAKKGEMSTIEGLINSGNTVSLQDEHGKVALHYAAEFGHNGTVEVLINKDSGLDNQDKQGKTALHYAAQNGHSATAVVLLQSNADTTIEDHQGLTALQYAIRNGHTLTASEIRIYARE